MTAAVTGPSRAVQDRSPDRMADAAAVDGLLRCWIRETGVVVPEAGELVLDLPASGTSLHTEVRYRSPAGFHRFGPTTLSTGTPAGAVAIATLLALEASADRTTSAGRAAAHDAVSDLAARVADSEQRVARHLRERGHALPDPVDTTPFLAAEQALVLGHPLHPTPKSRIGWTEAEAGRFSPELLGSFALHWFAADTSIVSHSGDLSELPAGFVPEKPAGTVAVPAHPWQAGELRARPEIGHLLDAGLLHDLGQFGPQWSPTASIRTVYHPHAPVMLKFSLGLPITNSKRENLRKELRRGAEIHRLLEAGLAAEIARAHPDFGVVRDPAWLAVDAPGVAESGLELVVRDNPFGNDDRVKCVAGLLAERPELGRSELASIVEDLAARTGMARHDIAEQWCARYFDHVIAPVLWLYETYGLGLEAHQQNTLVTLDAEGWPCGGWYRDNQGYYLSERRVTELERFLPGVGEEGDNRCADAVIDERLGYYIGINNLLGVVGALGSQGLADERRLLALFRARLSGFPCLQLARTLVHSATLRCKANLLTRVDGLDELVGPLETQSVYCDIANPLLGKELLGEGPLGEGLLGEEQPQEELLGEAGETS